MQYLYFGEPVRQVFSEGTSDKLDWSYEKQFGVFDNKSLIRHFVV